MTADIEHEDLGCAVHFAVKHDAGTIGRPLGRVGTAGDPIVERGEQFLVGTIGAHDVDLRQAGAGRNEGNPPPVGRVRRG